MPQAIIYVIPGTLVLLLLVWLRSRKSGSAEEGYEDRIADYNRECRLVKIDYRNGRIAADEARKRLEAIGDGYRIPKFRRTRSLGAIQLQKE